MHEIKTMAIYFYNSFYNGYCLCHVPCVRLRAVSLFSWSIEQNARDTQMTTQHSRARALPLLNLKKKRDCSQFTLVLIFSCFFYFCFFMYERIFYLQETIYRIAYSKRKHQDELLRIASLSTCTRCVPIYDRHTKCKCTVKWATKHVQLVLQHCCKTS